MGGGGQTVQKGARGQGVKEGKEEDKGEDWDVDVRKGGSDIRRRTPQCTIRNRSDKGVCVCPAFRPALPLHTLKHKGTHAFRFTQLAHSLTSHTPHTWPPTCQHSSSKLVHVHLKVLVYVA